MNTLTDPQVLARLLTRCEELKKASVALQARCTEGTLRGEILTLPQVALGQVLKQCLCGISYRYSEWKKLAFVGYQTLDFMRGQYRDCSCGSTLFVVTFRR